MHIRPTIAVVFLAAPGAMMDGGDVQLAYALLYGQA